MSAAIPALRFVALRFAALLGAAVLPAIAAAPAPAELPPWVYGERQRAAPLRLELRVESSRRREEGIEVGARILAIQRQPIPPRLRPGDRVRLLLPPPPSRGPGFAGPGPVPLPTVGARIPAWLAPLEGRPLRYGPAAGAFSFGPSLEDQSPPGP